MWKYIMSKGKISTFIANNSMLIVCVPLLIGIHWGWAKIQENPKLVEQENRKGIPIVEFMKFLKNKITNSSSPE